ncbi:MAG: CarD family transcriptional regulator [Eggerthella lenta]
MYACGDTVVYRHHVCEVAALRENYFEGKDYLELRALFENSLKLFVAVDEATPDNLRPIMSKRAALALIDSIVDADTIDENALKPDAPTPTLLERRMKEEYDKRLRTFAPEDLVPIMKSVHERRHRPARRFAPHHRHGQKYFDLAEGLLCDELAVSLAVPRENVKDVLVERVKRAEALRR